MAITFRNLPKGSTIGSGSYVFRHYGDETPIVVIPDYLCFTAEVAKSTVAMSVKGNPTKGQAFETSTDGVNWSAFTPGTTTITLSSIGDKVYFRGNNTTVSESSSIYYNFVMTGKIAASGNIMSLLDKTCQITIISNTYCFYNMFHSCKGLTTAPALPATTLASDCYGYMFYGCTSLTTAPALPSTTLESSCYRYMFYNCTSLTTAPALLATTLKTYCYSNMFYGCTSLTTAPALPATTLADTCYYNMFRSCISLTTAPALPATTLASNCYKYMFYSCRSLTTAPALPATTLASNCYQYMFYGCTSLQVYSSSGAGHTERWTIPTSGTASSYTSQSSMFYSCPGSYETTRSVSLNTTFYTQNTPVE